MKFVTYDKAKWHFGAESFPKDLPIENGGTHIAFFLRWCIEKDFLSKELTDDALPEIQKIKNGEADCRQFFIKSMDGVFTSEDLNAEGATFANAYYGGDKTKFAKNFGFYLADVDNWAKAQKNLTAKGGEEAGYYMENDEKTYSIFKTIIDWRYNEFLEMNKK